MDIPFRQTTLIDIGQDVLREYNEVFLSEDLRVKLKSDCAKLKELRDNISCEKPSLSNLKEYLGSLTQLSEITELKHVQFFWSNCLRSSSLVGGTGLLYERVNVMYNVAVAHTKSVGSSEKLERDWQMAANWFFKIGTLLQQNPSQVHELTQEIITFFVDLCTAVAKTYSDLTPSERWNLSEQFVLLWRELPNLKLTFVNNSLMSGIMTICKGLQETALISEAKRLHRSRKLKDQETERCLLLHVLEFNPKSKEANALLDEPLNVRNKNLTLRNLESNKKFSRDMFPTLSPTNENLNDSTVVLMEETPFDGALFLNVPPVFVAQRAIEMYIGLRNYVYNEIVTPLSTISEDLRINLAKFAVPLLMEYSYDTHSIPQCLHISVDINFFEPKTKQIAKEVEKLQNNYNKFSNLITLNDQLIAELVGIDLKMSTNRSKPILLQKAHNLTKVVHDNIQLCENDAMNCLSLCRDIDFVPMLMECSSRDEFDAVFTNSKEHFAELIASIQSRIDKKNSLIKHLKIIADKYQYTSTQKAVIQLKALYTSLLHCQHIQYRLKLLRMDDEELAIFDKSIESQPDVLDLLRSGRQ